MEEKILISEDIEKFIKNAKDNNMDIKISQLQIELSIGFSKACKILDLLIEKNLIAKKEDGKYYAL